MIGRSPVNQNYVFLHDSGTTLQHIAVTEELWLFLTKQFLPVRLEFYETITHRIHGTGIFRCMNGWFLCQIYHTYCWWFRNPPPVEVGSLSTGFYTSQVVGLGISEPSAVWIFHSEVVSIHDLHVWTMGSSTVFCTAHVVVSWSNRPSGATHLRKEKCCPEN